MLIQKAIILASLVITPAFADDSSRVSQVTAQAFLRMYNTSTVSQVGNSNISEIDQTGSFGVASTTQRGNGNAAQIVQTGFGDVATTSQIGNALAVKIVQTGPAQHITVVQHR